MKTSHASAPVRILLGLAVVVCVLLLGGAGGAAADRLITGKQIQDGTVTTKDIRDKTLRAIDLSPTAKKALRGEPGAAGPRGPVGPVGPAGPSGTTDITVRAQWKPATSASAALTVWCKPDERALSAGIHSFGESGGKPLVVDNYPQPSVGVSFYDHNMAVTRGGGWYAKIENAGTSGGVGGVLYVQCARD